MPIHDLLAGGGGETQNVRVNIKEGLNRKAEKREFWKNARTELKET